MGSPAIETSLSPAAKPRRWAIEPGCTWVIAVDTRTPPWICQFNQWNAVSLCANCPQKSRRMPGLRGCRGKNAPLQGNFARLSTDTPGRMKREEAETWRRIAFDPVRACRAKSPCIRQKNAVLPLMCGALLTRETVTIEQIPALTDVKTLTDILRDCGVFDARGSGGKKLLALTADSPRSPRREDLLSRMRASVLVMGPLLARTGYARVALPGGCAIGQRPIDLHLKGMEALGAHVEQTPGFVTFRGKLRGGNVYLDFPSVGATENILMAAALARGTTRIEKRGERAGNRGFVRFPDADGRAYLRRRHVHHTHRGARDAARLPLPSDSRSH